MIELRSVSKSFYTRTTTVEAVKDVSLSVRRGEVYGVIGYSGAGKSTLVRCINLLEKPDRGSVIVDGKVLTALEERELRSERRRIGMIFQHFNLFASRTVAENIRYPLKHSGLSAQDQRRKVDQLMELVGLSDKAGAYPSQLSGGQKQRVGIARALANDPRVLLCDEATSALDPQTTRSILLLLKELNEKLGLTIVIITHEMQVIKAICHRAAVMEGGRVVEEGSIFDIFSAPKEKVTRDFIETTSCLHKIHDLLAEDSPAIRLKPGDILAQFSYVGRSTVDALISTASVEFGVKLNIIFGDLEIVQHTPLGGLVVILSGGGDSPQRTIEWFRGQGVRVEVIKHG